MGKFFFTLSLKGAKPPITEAAKYNNAKELGLLDRHGNYKVEQKPCPIESSINARLKQPGESLANVVPKKDTKEGEEGVFKLKLKGGQPQLQKAAAEKENA